MVEPISVSIGVAAAKLVLNAVWNSPSIKLTLDTWFKPREAKRAVKRIHVKQVYPVLDEVATRCIKLLMSILGNSS